MKIRSRAYIQLGEDTLKTVHKTFQPRVPVILHLLGLTDGSLSSKETTTPTLFVIQEGLNCLEMIDYFFTNIEPKLIIVEHSAAHHSTSTPQQPLNGDKVSQKTHPQQPEETQIHPSMLINRYPRSWDVKRIHTGYTGSPITLQSPDEPNCRKRPTTET